MNEDGETCSGAMSTHITLLMLLLCVFRMEKDRIQRAKKRQGLIDSLQYEWQRQRDLKALMNETEKQLR